MTTSDGTSVDVVLIGAGIMSATLGALLKQLEPATTIEVFERLDREATESSDAWNNAGTGHSAFCELNYTPERADGSIDIAKAIAICESFEVSKQLWASLASKGVLPSPQSFIRRIPHMSFVWGDANVDYLRRRYAALQSSHLFHGMQISEEPIRLAEWMPLTMDGRDTSQPLAATRMDIGTDVNFGALTAGMFGHLRQMDGVSMHFNCDVLDLDRDRQGRWRVRVSDRRTGAGREVRAKFVFIGAGGGSLPLLQKSGIPEGRGYAGFPVSGIWLKCVNTEVIERHQAKVYGKAAVGAPPMSVPHLDTRVIEGRKELLFGPYAGFSTRFLKNGSLFDLPLSVKLGNIVPMLVAGLDNIPLTKYLIDQVLQSPEDRMAALRDFVPQARQEDWELEVAGQRVQVIRQDEQHGGVLEFGTEVVSAGDGSLAALLGASPGASTAVSIMLTLLGRCFPDQMATEAWQARLRQLIPSFGRSLAADPQLLDEVRAFTADALGLSDARSGAPLPAAEQ
jgi:malate dehydrogenase (quinone)